MNTTNIPTTDDDVIDSRDVIAAIMALTDDDATPDERATFHALVALNNEGVDYSPDWEYGATLVRDSYFRQYAIELAYDCGLVPDDLSWPMTCIDWEQAARELQMDYTAVEFDGVTYWVR